MLLIEPNLKSYGDAIAAHYKQTPLYFLTQGDTSGAYDALEQNVERINRDFSNPNTQVEAAMDLVTPMAKLSGILGTVGKFDHLPNQFLENTPTNPNPLVGTRYARTDLGLLVPQQNIKAEELYNSLLIPKLSDMTSRGQQIDMISGMPLKNPFTTTGGFDYPRDKLLNEKGVIYASNEQALQKDLDRIINAKNYFESQNVPVENIFLTPTTMSEGSEYFSDMSAKAFLNFIDNGRISKELINELDTEIRNFAPKKNKDGSITYPTKDWKGIMTPEGRDQLANNAKYRKALAKRMEIQKYGKQMGFNYEDIRGAVLEDRLKGVDPNMFGDTLIKINPDKLQLVRGNHPAYSHDALGAEGVFTLGHNLPIKNVLYGDDFFEALKRGELTTQVKKGKEIPADDISQTKQADKNTFGRLYDGTSGVLGGFIDDQAMDRILEYQRRFGLL